MTVALLLTRNTARLQIPWRITVQVAGLVILAQALGLHPPSPTALTLPTLLAVALGTGAIAALINNLPASVWAASLLAAGPLAYAATIGLAVGALAAPQGSVATIIATDLAGPTTTATHHPAPRAPRDRRPPRRNPAAQSHPLTGHPRPHFVLFVLRQRVAQPVACERAVTTSRSLQNVAARHQAENSGKGAQNGRLWRRALCRAGVPIGAIAPTTAASSDLLPYLYLNPSVI